MCSARDGAGKLYDGSAQGRCTVGFPSARGCLLMLHSGTWGERILGGGAAHMRSGWGAKELGVPMDDSCSGTSANPGGGPSKHVHVTPDADVNGGEFKAHATRAVFVERML